MILSLLVEQLPDLPARNEEWRALGIAAGNPFTTWEWASAWWREFGEERRQLILGCRDGEGALVGVLPLYLASRHPRTLRIVGHGAADQLGPVCRPEHREAVAAALRGALAERRGWTVFAAERLAVAEGWPRLLGGHRTRRERSLTIHPRTADWDQFLSGYSANFRAQVRKFERRLERNHDLRYRIADDPERVDADMSLFLDLHAARWGDRSRVYAGGLEAFHRELARLALAQGFLRLSFLELDGEPCAGIHAFRLGGVDWIYQQGWSPDMAGKRVGRVLFNHALREAVEDGMDEFKLLLGEEEYKDHYSDEDAPVETVAVGRGVLADAALAAVLPLRRALHSLQFGRR